MAMVVVNFKDALQKESPLQVVGTINAYTALLAERAGFQAIYLSGAGVANASYGLPDLAATTLDNVLEDVRRIRGATSLPLLVDADTGFGNRIMIGRTVKGMIQAGASAIHLEDQVFDKRCGHRPNKTLVSTQEMCDRIKTAVDARSDPNFVIMARTDSSGADGLDRAAMYVEAGADMLFPEAMTQLEDYMRYKAIGVPILANITEFGKTPLFTLDQLRAAGVDMALYPLSAFRAMSRAAESVFATIRREGTQEPSLPSMQTREELYTVLNYHTDEEKQ